MTKNKQNHNNCTCNAKDKSCYWLADTNNICKNHGTCKHKQSTVKQSKGGTTVTTTKPKMPKATISKRPAQQTNSLPKSTPTPTAIPITPLAFQKLHTIAKAIDYFTDHPKQITKEVYASFQRFYESTTPPIKLLLKESKDRFKQSYQDYNNK